MKRPSRKYYVYMLYRLDGRPCYVGKGSGSRYKEHEKGITNRHLWNIIRKSGGSIPKKIIKRGLYEWEAFALEIQLIKEIGREKHGGPLVNYTDGGEGPSGMEFSEAAKKKIANSSKNKWADEEFRNKMKSIQKAAQNTSHIRKQKSEQSLARWADPNYRKRVIESHKVLWTPERRKKQSKTLLRVLGSEEQRAKKSEIAKAAWASRSSQRMKEISEQRKRITTLYWASLSIKRRNEIRRNLCRGAQRRWKTYHEREP